MILESLVQLARREGLLADPDYEPKPVAWFIAIGDGGRFVDLVPTAGEAEKGKKPRAKVFAVPRRKGRTSGADADFLVDKSEYVLGVEPDRKRSGEDLRARMELFRGSVEDALERTKSPALAAVAGFLASDIERGRATERVTAEGYRSNDLFAFEFHGQIVHMLPEVRAYFSTLRRGGAEAGRQCLICGSMATCVDKHPPVKIPGGTTSGIALVSFNSEAFESYGLLRNENAPVCRDCADGYTTALDRLLSDRYPDPRHPGETLPRRRVRLSPDTTAVFWTGQEATLEDLFANFFEAPRVESVRALFEASHKGRPATASERFYCAVLSGGQGRATVRGMHTGTVAQVEQNLRAYFAEIEIGGEQPLPLQLLLRGLVLQGKLENVPPGLETDVFLAIVFGGPFPLTLLARAVGRCRAERRVSRERAAVVRAFAIRNLRREVSVGLDKENTSAGYRLGRLMAVLERVQVAAQHPNKTIVDRYYSAASTRPGTVFPRLIEMSVHHRANLTVGLASYFQSQMGEVLDGLDSFKPTLTLEDQGLFALGYYHQRQEFFKKHEDAPEDGGNGDEKGEAA